MIKIKEIVKEIFDQDPDGITFLPTQTKDIHFTGFTYDKKSKYEKNRLGHVYHIVVYKADKFGNIHNPDNFVANLTDPKVYVYHLIQSGFFGIVVKKTKASTKFINEIYKKIILSCHEK